MNGEVREGSENRAVVRERTNYNEAQRAEGASGEP